MKKQIIIIHGGNSYRSYNEYLEFLRKKQLDFENLNYRGWKDGLAKKFGRGYEVLMPPMPNASNAKYLEWKIWFGKLVPFLEREVVLIGHSLGAIFLVKYLSEEAFAKKILATILVAAPFDEKDIEDSLADFRLKRDLGRLEKQSERLIFFHSRDDEVVPFADFLKYKHALPGAQFREFKKRGHFLQRTFPELESEIEKIFKGIK